MAHRDGQLTLSHDDFWGRKLARLEAIPLDILHLLADHLSVQDLIALSTASRSLQYLLSDPGVWRKLYMRPGFILPPGPHDWQSTSYLVDLLLRAERLYSVWPSSSSCPEILHTRSMSFGCDVTFSVLLGRWLLVAEGSTLVCYDSRSSNIPDSVKTLFDDGANRPILRVFSVGSVREGGVLAFAVLLFNDSFTIAKILMDQGEPCTIQTVLTSKPIIVEGWTDHVDVRLYHRLLVVNIGECSSDWESFGRLVIMDIDTLRRYHIPPATHGAPFNPVQTITFFLATKSHLIRVVEFSNRHKVRFKVECFPLPTTHGTPESDILYPSHQSGIVYGPKLRQCAVIHESPKDSENGETSFTLCGLNSFMDGDRLEIVEVFLKPDGSISLTSFAFARYLVTSLCIGVGRQHACGITLRMGKHPLVFAIDYRGPGSFSFKYSVLDRCFPESELVPLDTFGGTAFFSRRSKHQTSVEIVDFTRDAQKAKGRLPEYASDSELKVTCDCGWRYRRPSENDVTGYVSEGGVLSSALDWGGYGY